VKLLECRDLSAGYEGVPVFEHLSFVLNDGDYLCVIGENGSGKTTFLRTLLGLLKPMHGTIEFSGLKKNEIGYVPQQSAVQKDFPASVEEVVLSGCISRGPFRPFWRREDRENALKQMQHLGIEQFRKRSFMELSGGQQQRVRLARAMCAADRLLVLDEPVTGLDPQTSAEMYSLIQTLNREGMAIIMITHDIPAAEAYATHILSFEENVHFCAKNAFFGKEAADVE